MSSLVDIIFVLECAFFYSHMSNKLISHTHCQKDFAIKSIANEKPWCNTSDPVCDLFTLQPPFVCFLVLSSAGVIERWELLQARAVREEQCYSRDREQLTSDLHNITSWLGQVIPELEKLRNAETACVSVQIMEARVKQLKVRAHEGFA